MIIFRTARAIWEIPVKEGEVFWQRKCELIANFSATMVTILEGRDGKCEGRNKKCEFLARESVNSSPFVRIFGKGKCKAQTKGRRERKRKGKEEEEKERGRKRGREIGSEALAETEKIANAPGGNRTRDPSKRGWCSTIENVAQWRPWRVPRAKRV